MENTLTRGRRFVAYCVAYCVATKTVGQIGRYETKRKIT